MKITDWLLVIVGLLQVFVGGWMIAIYRRQAGIMKQQAVIADRQAALMSDQLKVAQQAADAARLAFERAERLDQPALFPIPTTNLWRILEAFKTKDSSVMDFGFPSAPGVSFVVKNYGKTPAILERILAKLVIADFPPEPDNPWPSIELPSEYVLAPLSMSESRSTQMTGYSLEQADYDGLMSGAAAWWFFGIVRYRDIHGAAYEQHFCWRYTARSRSFDPYPWNRNFTRRIGGQQQA